MRSARPNAAATALSFPFGRETAIRSGAVRVRRASITSTMARFRRGSVLLFPWLLGIGFLVVAAVPLSGSIAHPQPLAPAALPGFRPPLRLVPPVLIDF